MKTTKASSLLSQTALFGKSALIATGVALSTTLFSTANAATMNFSSELSTGDQAGVDFFLDDSVKDGSVDVTVKVNGTGDGIADISGVWFHIADESLIPGLTFDEIDYTAVGVGTNSEFITKISLGENSNNLGNGVNLNGSGPNNFDVGLRIGQSGGINGGDDFRSITFRIGHTTEDLDLSLFSEEGWGTRLKSVGANRNGSSKLQATAPTFTMDPVDNSQNLQNPEGEGEGEVQVEGDNVVGNVIGAGENGGQNQGGSKQNTGSDTTRVPEPGTIFGLAFVGAMMMRKFRRQSH